MKQWTLCISSLILIVSSNLLFAFEPVSNIEFTIKNFVTQNTSVATGDSLEIKIDPVNLAYQMPNCSTPIEANFPQNANHEHITNVEVSCKGTSPWHLLVPVDVEMMTEVVSAVRPIPPKQPITENDLSFTAYNKNKLYEGYFSKKEDVIGNETNHLITAGTVLTKSNVSLPVIVHREQVIDLSAQYNTIVVTMQGVAKSDGILNAVIKVYNPSSKRTLDAIVTGPNKAQVVI